MQYDQIQEAVAYIRSKSKFEPRFGVILGSGLGGFTDVIEIEKEIPYGNIPHFPVSTAPGHAGKLVFGTFAGIPLVAMAGRLHFYEGYSLAQVAFPVRVMKFLGVETFITSCASGSVHPDIVPGHIVLIKDHINLIPDNPLRGPNDERLGPRFPDLLHAYDQDLIEKALKIAHELNIPAHAGVLASFPGPILETAAEYIFARKIGADIVGMSIVPEVIVAKHMELPVFALSLVTDQFIPGRHHPEVTSDHVLAVARENAPRMQKLVGEVLKRLTVDG